MRMLNPRSFILDQRILFVGEEPGLAELEESENISPRAVVCRGGAVRVQVVTFTFRTRQSLRVGSLNSH